MYTLGGAAKLCGRSKTALANAIKAGKLSATRNEDGSYQIDPAELGRVYPATVRETVKSVRSETPVDPEVSRLLTLVEERQKLVEAHAETIADLRRRLDQLTAILTDQRLSRPVEVKPPETGGNRRRWWRFRV